MATKKAGGSKARQKPRVPGKRLGLKVGDGQVVSTGAILIRQRGTKLLAGDGVGVGRDHTLFALRPGMVKLGFAKGGRKQVSITPQK